MTTNPDGSLKHTYSWGNEGNNYDALTDIWLKDRPEDVSAANAYLDRKAEWDNKSLLGKIFSWFNPLIREGDASLDLLIEDVWKEWRGDPSHSSRHDNGLVFNNCKSEAKKLLDEAKRRQKQESY